MMKFKAKKYFDGGRPSITSGEFAFFLNLGRRSYFSFNSLICKMKTVPHCIIESKDKWTQLAIFITTIGIDIETELVFIMLLVGIRLRSCILK